MKKLKLSILTAFMMSGMLFTQSAQAQTNPCGWTLLSQICSQPTCPGACDATIIVTPDIVLPNVVYNWSNGSNSSQQYNLCAEVYVVTVTDANGCSQEFSYELIDPAPLVASCITTADESAPGAADGSIEASVMGGYGPYEFEWQTSPIQYGATLSGLTAGTYTVIVYDEKKCMTSTTCEVITEELSCGGFRTQTQGGWGQCHQNGNNPGTYLFANFDAAFPSDLTIGCTRTLTLTSAQAVCDFLSSGTTPRILNAGAMVDPGQTYRNVFAGQLVAATLNVRFDVVDPNFGASGVNLGALIITSGTFAGWSVNALIAEANRKIGGCASIYTASQLSGALDAVNNNYTDGRSDRGFLACPTTGNRMQASGNFSNLSVSVNPNPVRGNGTISVVSVQDDMLQVDVYNVAGQKTANLFKGAVKSQESLNLNLDAATMESGIYFIKVITSGNVLTQKFVVNN